MGPLYFVSVVAARAPRSHLCPASTEEAKKNQQMASLLSPLDTFVDWHRRVHSSRERPSDVRWHERGWRWG